MADEQEQDCVQEESNTYVAEPRIVAPSSSVAPSDQMSAMMSNPASATSPESGVMANLESGTTAPSTSAPSSQSPTPLSEDERIDPQSIMEGLPPVNWGALFMPPIWGPAHGIWITILYYPVWLLADNLLYEAYSNPSPLSAILAALTVLILAAVTVVFARAGQEYACRRALVDLGKTKQWYRDRQKIWAVAMAVVAIIFLAAATYYNLFIRSTVGA